MLPSWLEAVILGVVQGITEFIPVSSSGHLVLVPNLFGWERPGLAFDVALHVGTAAALILYFRRDLMDMVHAVLSPRSDPYHRRLGLYLAAATVPVAIAGAAGKTFFEQTFESTTVAGAFLLVTAAAMLGGEWVRSRRVARLVAPVPAPDDEPAGPAGAPEQAPPEQAPPEQTPPEGTGYDPADPTGTDLTAMSWRQALTVGLAQMVALFPGMSRSGTTISAGIAAGLTREAATRFSFLLALPALLGAAVVSLPDLREPGVYSSADIAAGVVAAFIAGYIAVAFLVRTVARLGLRVFVGYLVVVGSAALVSSLA